MPRLMLKSLCALLPVLILASSSVSFASDPAERVKQEFLHAWPLRPAQNK